MFEKMIETMMKSMPKSIMDQFQDNIAGISNKVTEFDMRLRRVESINIASFEMLIAIARKLDIEPPTTALKVEQALHPFKTQANPIEQETTQNAA